MATHGEPLDLQTGLHGIDAVCGWIIRLGSARDAQVAELFLVPFVWRLVCALPLGDIKGCAVLVSKDPADNIVVIGGVRDLDRGSCNRES